MMNEIKILLIDDDEDDYVHIRDLFDEISRSKYKIEWKSTYESGFSALQEQDFDACLLDYRLGAKTGLDLLQSIRKLNLRCPIIFLTGLADFDLDLKAMQVGAADYLVKGQLTSPLLERSVRYSMKQALDLEELRDIRAQVLQQDRLASLGLLASSLAHEIGTPLGVIRSRAELAQKKAGDNENLKNDMVIVVSQIDRISKLVNSLLHLARGKQSDFAVEVSIGEVIQDVLNLLQHEVDRKNIELNVQVIGPALVRAEPGPLGQVLLNLLINSIHAIEEARRLGRSEKHRINMAVEDKAELVKISVQDTGCGISNENLPQIFKPFFTTKGIGLGTGLGLATSYKIIHSWGGAISVESQVGKGTTFSIALSKMSK